MCAGTLQRTLAGHTQVQEGSMTMLVAAEPRIALALEPPAGSPSQPLTLAGLRVSPCPSCFPYSKCMMA